MPKLSHELIGLLRGASFVFLCRVGGAGIAFVTQVLLARWMGAEELGIYVFAFSTALLVATVTGLGLPTAAIAFVGAALARARSDLIVGFARRSAQIIVAAGTLTALGGGLLIWLLDAAIEEQRRAALLLGCLMIPLFGASASRAAVALGLSWVPMATFPNTVFRPLVFLLLVACAFFVTGAVSSATAMTMQLLAIVVMTVAQWWLLSRGLARDHGRPAPAFETPAWLRAALPLLVITLFVNFFIELNLVIAGFHLAPEELAIFNAGFRTAGLIAFGIAAVDTIMMPRVSRLHAAGDMKGLQRNVTQAARLRFWGATAGCLPLLVIGEPLLGLFGEEFVSGFWALLILAGSQLVSAVFGPAARLLSVTGYQDQCLGVSLVSLAALLVLHPLLIGAWGINGAAVAVLLVTVGQSAWLSMLAARHLEVQPLPYFLRLRSATVQT